MLGIKKFFSKVLVDIKELFSKKEKPKYELEKLLLFCFEIMDKSDKEEFKLNYSMFTRFLIYLNVKYFEKNSKYLWHGIVNLQETESSIICLPEIRYYKSQFQTVFTFGFKKYIDITAIRLKTKDIRFLTYSDDIDYNERVLLKRELKKFIDDELYLKFFLDKSLAKEYNYKLKFE